MTSDTKKPVIAIIDDQLAVEDENFSYSKADVIKTLRNIATGLGYDAEAMLAHVRFFEHPKVRFPADQNIILAFVDNNFAVDGRWVKVGNQIVQGLRYSFPLAEIVWASTDNLEGAARSEMEAQSVLFGDSVKVNLVNLQTISSEGIIALANSESNALHPSERGAAFVIQRYKRAFEVIAAYQCQSVADDKKGESRSALDMARRGGQETQRNSAEGMQGGL